MTIFGSSSYMFLRRKLKMLETHDIGVSLFCGGGIYCETVLQNIPK